MAERRMFAKTIIDSDAFIDMPVTARLLYYDLAMRADDDGFVNSPKKIMRMIGVSQDDLSILIMRKFIIPFDNGVVVIKHWRIHNYIRKDMYHETKYKEQKDTLMLDENNAYTLSNGTPVTDTLQGCNEVVTNPSTQVRLGKDRLGKDSSISCQQDADDEEINEVVDAFKEICVSLPVPKVISETRKKNIRGKLRKYSIDDLKLAFRKTEESDFLSGRSGVWSACNFDWLIKYEGNIIKVLEGVYDNKNNVKDKAIADMRQITDGMTQEEYEDMERRFK